MSTMYQPHVDSKREEWWKSFHVMAMADLFLARTNEAELNQTVSFLWRELRLEPGAHVYDQCCGTGTLSMGLSRSGIATTGCDLCGAYIERARESVAAMSGRGGLDVPQFHCEDAFAFVPNRSCEGVINWYSSFGYSHDDDQNTRMLIRAWESLKPGGYFALDVPNFIRVLTHFQTTMTHLGTSDGRSVRLTRLSDIDHRRGLLHQIWRWEIDGYPPDERESFVRIYLPYQICKMLETIGFEQIRLFGDIASTPFQTDSLRLIVIARKPE